MMSLQNDMELMANEPEREGAELAAPNLKNETGLEAHDDKKNYPTDVPDFVGAGRRLGPSPTLSSHGDDNGGCPIHSKTDWRSGYSLESGRGLPRGSGEYNGTEPM